MGLSPSLETLPNALLDTLVSNILETCPSLAVAFLSAFGTRVHASAVRVLFTNLTVPDDARCFLAPEFASVVSRNPISAILQNSDRYARAVKRLSVTDVGLPTKPAGADSLASLGLVTIEEEDVDAQEGERQTRVAFQPMPTENLTALLMVFTNLEEFIWSSANPPPDGVCETLSEHNPRLTNFTFKPDKPFRTPAGTSSAAATRPTVPKWDAPSLPLLSVLPLTRLHVTRLSQQGARALATLFSHFGEYSLLEDVCLDFVWLDDPLCEKLVEAGRRIRRLKVGTSGTKLTDKGIVSVFEGCDCLEDFGLIEAQGRLSRHLWSKLSTLPTNLKTFKIAISESGPHHSWTADHLLSFSSLQLDILSHLSVIRIVQPPHLLKTGDILEHDAHIDDVSVLKCIPKDVVASIRDATGLKVLECDWWAWKPEDVKALLERCTQLEHLKLAFDAPFSKLLTLTSNFTPVTKLLKLSVSIPSVHAPNPGPVLVPASPQLKMSPTHPLTPAASPVRRRSSLPSPDSEHFPQTHCPDDLKASGQVDPSMPLIREVKRFVKKCPRLVELEWYGRNARGKWFISRSVTTSKINTNVTVEHHPPVISPSVWKRASQERAFAEAMDSDGYIFQTITRQGHTWTGPKAEQLSAERAAEKEKEDILMVEKPGRTNGTSKRLSASLTTTSAGGFVTGSSDRQTQGSHSPVQPFTPLSPPTSTKSFAPTQENVPVESTSRAAVDTTISPRRTPSEPSLRTNSTNGRARSATASGGVSQGGPGTNGRGRNGNSAGHGGHRDGRARGSAKSVGGSGSKRNSAAGGANGSGRGGGSGRGHGAGRGGKRKTPTTTH